MIKFYTFESVIRHLKKYNLFYMKFTYKFFLQVLIPVALFIFTPKAYTQTVSDDSCSKLRFHTAIEREGFLSLCRGVKPDYLAMAVAVNPEKGMDELQKIKETIRKETSLLRTSMAGIKKPAKKLKFVFDHIQSTFLKQYDLDADFSDMFETGKHNCLTATILYALVFDDLAIKHSIKFMPGHVYLIAYADEIPYIIETTDPIGGFVELNKTMQSNAIQSLRLMKFMTSDNGKNKSTGDLFDRYYIKLNNTEMKGLVGYQYTNAAFTAMLKQDFMTAYDLIIKSIELTPMDELNILKEELLKQCILQANKTTSRRAELLVDYYNTTKNENKKNQVADEFKQCVYQILFSSFPSPDSLLPVFNTLYNGISDTDMKKVLEDSYTTAYVEYLQVEGNNQEVFEMLYKAYDNGNKTSYIKTSLHNSINLLSDGIHFDKGGVAAYDSLAFRYPKLMEFDVFVYNRCQMLLSKAEEAFQMKNSDEGERLLKKFDTEAYFDRSKPSYCNPASVYSLAGSYYFRKGNSSKAKVSLKKGLTFDPDNWEIKKKLSELN